MGTVSRMRKVSLLCALTLAIIGSGLTSPASASGSRLALDAALVCASGGGANLTYTVTNTGDETARLGDLHFTLTRMTQGGPQGGGVVFLFPSHDFAVIPAGESRTWVVGIGTAMPGEPGGGTDLSARRLILETEVWMAGYDSRAKRTFPFPGCNG